MISTRVESINRDVALMLADDLSPAARSAALAEFAADEIADAEAANRQAFGGELGKEVFVDGRSGAPLTSVRPSGVIVAEFDLVFDVVDWIGQQLLTHSPRRSGRYVQSHLLFVDGLEVALGTVVPDAQEYAFINSQPYARKIEAGLSSQAPDGVYQTVASVAAKRFGNIARVYFDYRDAGFRTTRKLRVNDNKGTVERRARGDSSGRNPAIIVRVG